jgi:hypothetical protein
MLNKNASLFNTDSSPNATVDIEGAGLAHRHPARPALSPSPEPAQAG